MYIEYVPSKYTLTYTRESNKIVFEFEEDNLVGMLQQYEQFLKACGFYFNGSLDFVDDETAGD